MNAKQLKNSILQLAVQGKLVPQDPNDEPASVLIQKIRAKKNKLIKEKKIKKEKSPSYIFRGSDNLHYEKIGDGEPVCIEEKLPFEIPDSWEWVRLGTLMSVISDGTHKTPTYVEKGIPFLSVQNISKGYFDLSKIKYITQEEHEILIKRVKPEKNDILMCRIGTLGKAIKCTLDFEFSIFVSLGLLRPIDSETSDYIVFVLNSPLVEQWIQDNKVGGGTHTFKINLIDLPNILLPIPPINEQARIFAKFNELEHFIQEYEQSENNLLKLNLEFPSALKKSILQEAVQGKLVPQDPTDEPASVLLKRIREEKVRLIKVGKIKKEKNESIIFRRDNSYYEKLNGIGRRIDNELPFEIPDSWEWVRLNSIVSKEIKRGKSPKYADHGEHYVFAQKCNVKTGGINMSLAKYLSDDVLQKYPTDEYMQDSDIIVNSTGNGTLGRIGIFHDSDRISNGEIVPDSHVTVVRTIAEVNTSFVYYTLKYYQPFLEKQGDGSTNQTELKPVTIASLFIPLPPIAEQQRIVAKIEQFHAMIKGL